MIDYLQKLKGNDLSEKEKIELEHLKIQLVFKFILCGDPESKYE